MNVHTHSIKSQKDLQKCRCMYNTYFIWFDKKWIKCIKPFWPYFATEMIYLGHYSVVIQMISRQTHTLELTCFSQTSVLTNTVTHTFLFSLAFTRRSAGASQINSIWWPAQRFMYSQRKVRKYQNTSVILWCELGLYTSGLMQTVNLLHKISD